MNTLLEVGVTNAAIATMLACVVWLVTRYWRHPALVHALWVIVLLKLVTPPLLSIPWHLPPTAAHSRASLVRNHVTTDNESAAQPLAFAQIADSPGQDGPSMLPEESLPESEPDVLNVTPADSTVAAVNHTPVAESNSLNWKTAAAWLWLGGSICFLAVALLRVLRFHRALRSTLPPTDDLEQLAGRVAAKFGVRRFRLRMTDGRLAPLVWPLGRPIVLLSRPLVEQLSSEETQTLLAHEFAHLRRKDHWVRWLELAASTLYWWHPVVWWARRIIRTAEEQACDAWAVWGFPDSAECYAAALFKAVQFVSARPQRTPAIASRLTAGREFKERIEHIMNAPSNHQLSRNDMLALLLIVLVVLPLSARAVQAEKNAATLTADQPAAQVEPAAVPATVPPGTGMSDTKAARVIQSNWPINISIQSDGEPPSNVTYKIDSNGDVDLGPRFGRVHVAGLTDEEAEAALVKNLQATLKNPKVRVLSAGRSKQDPNAPRPEVAQPNDELDVLRDQVKFLDEHAKRIDAKFLAGVQGGSREALETANYELSRAKADLALAEGNKEQAIAAMEAARKHAEQALKAVTAQYESGNLTQEALLQANRNLIEARQKLVQVQKLAPIAPTAKALGDAPPPPPANFPAVNQVPLADQKIRVGMPLIIRVAGTPPDAPIADAFMVQPDGTVALGPLYGRVRVEGLSIAEAEPAVQKHLQNFVKGPLVQITVPSPMQTFEPRRVPVPTGLYHIAPGEMLHVSVVGGHADPIVNDFVVEPGGMLPLGPVYGRVSVGGLTLVAAEDAVKKALAERVGKVEVQVTLGGWQRGPRDAFEPALEAIPSTSAQSIDVSAIEAQASTPPSLGVLKTIFAKKQVELNRVEQLAKDKAVSAAELEATRADVAIARERFRQAERALKYYRLQISIAEAEYESMLQANKQTPHSVSDLDVKRAQIKVELAKAKLEELAQ